MNRLNGRAPLVFYPWLGWVGGLLAFLPSFPLLWLEWGGCDELSWATEMRETPYWGQSKGRRIMGPQCCDIYQPRAIDTLGTSKRNSSLYHRCTGVPCCNCPHGLCLFPSWSPILLHPSSSSCSLLILFFLCSEIAP